MLVRMMTRMTEKKHGLADTCKDDLHQDDTRMMTASNFNCTHSQDDAGMIRRMMTRMTEKKCGLEKKIWTLKNTNILLSRMMGVHARMMKALSSQSSRFHHQACLCATLAYQLCFFFDGFLLDVGPMLGPKIHLK